MSEQPATLSPWCWTPPGFRHTAQQHAVCQMRQEHPDERVRIRACGCTEHGGHEKTEGNA